MELLKLSAADEAELADSAITQWLSPAFFATPFWVMWATTFAFQPWHSAVEFKRYLHRFMLEFSRIETLAGVKRTIYNQYDSLVRPLQHWLSAQGVNFVTDCRVTDLEFDERLKDVMVTAICTLRGGVSERIVLDEGDLTFVQNGSMTDASSLGSMSTPPAQLDKTAASSWNLWEKLAAGRPQFGRPAAFNQCIAQSCWESFTVTLRDPAFFDFMQRYSGNEAGTGGLVTFQDSSWLMSLVLAHQPHFAAQPADVQVFWGYALFPDRVGDFVAKSMADCDGEDILREIGGHLHIDYSIFGEAICIPCRMPYITSQFMPRLVADRPAPIPAGSRNLGLISQFVEIAHDTVFTVEYSVRAAQTAVYGPLGVKREIPAVSRHDQNLHTQFQALMKAFE